MSVARGLADLVRPFRLRKKIGVHCKARTRSFRDGNVLKGHHVPERAALFERYRRALDVSTQRGWACHVDALFESLKALQPGDEGSFKFSKAFHGHTPPTKNWKMEFLLLPAKDEALDSILIAINLPSLFSLQCSILEAKDGTANMTRCSMSWKAGVRREILQSTALDQPEIDVAAEGDYLSDTFSNVVNRFCNEITFQSYEEAASMLSEALLHVIEFQTSILRIGELSLRVTFDGISDSPAVCLRAVAKWKTADGDLTSDDPESREVEVSVKNEDQEADQGEQDEDQEPNDDAEDNEECAAVPASEVSTGVPESTAAGQDIISQLVEKGSSSTYLVLENWTSKRYVKLFLFATKRRLTFV